jgi:hypothetical protein
MKSSIFNIDTLIQLEQFCWIVSKNNPNVPILKITQSDFKLIKSGIYKSQGNKIEFNGNVYWLPTELSNKLKVKLKLNDLSFENLAISMQEFLNKDIIDEIKPKFLIENIIHLKNTNEDIYVICSRQTKRSYEGIVKKLEEKLAEEGILIKNFYYISETFYNQTDDDIKYKKIKLLLQHLIGYKTENDKFIDEELSQYNTINFYDDTYDTPKIADEINPAFKIILDKTVDGLKSVIKEDLSDNRPCLIVNQISTNQVNKKITKKVDIEYFNLIKTFEGFDIFKKIK